jgi:acylphosphatase
VIKGDVQGVGMRYAVRRCALEMGLAGTVRNLADGGVEIHAQGDTEKLEKLADWLRREAPGTITGIECRYFPVTEPLSDFKVIK